MLLHQLPGNTQPFGETFRLVPPGVCVLENNLDHTVFRGIFSVGSWKRARIVVVIAATHEHRLSRELIRDLEAYHLGVKFLGSLQVLDEDAHMPKSPWPQHIQPSFPVTLSLQFFSHPHLLWLAHVIPPDLVHPAVELDVVSVRVEEVDRHVTSRPPLPQP